MILGQYQSRSRCPRPHKVRAQVTGSHNLSLFFLRPPPSFYLCPSPAILIWLCRLVLVLTLPHLPRWVRDQDSTEFRALYLFVLSAGPTCCLCSHEGLCRLCHITIRLRPRLSRAFLLSLFSMPDKLSDCRSFQFFPKKMASFRFSDFSSLIPIFKKIFVQW